MELLLEQIKNIVDKDIPLVSNLSNIAALLYKLDDINWAGFYLVEGDVLYLGPFQGDVACTTIPKGRALSFLTLTNSKVILLAHLYQKAK